jgi:hypothetical protein
MGKGEKQENGVINAKTIRSFREAFKADDVEDKFFALFSVFLKQTDFAGEFADVSRETFAFVHLFINLWLNVC